MAAVDNFADYTSGLDSPYTKGEAVTKSDATDGSGDFTNVSRAIWVGGTGTMIAIMPDDSELTFTSIPAGTLLKIRAKRVKSTSTTATNMVALS